MVKSRTPNRIYWNMSVGVMYTFISPREDTGDPHLPWQFKLCGVHYPGSLHQDLHWSQFLLLFLGIRGVLPALFLRAVMATESPVCNWRLTALLLLNNNSQHQVNITNDGIQNMIDSIKVCLLSSFKIPKKASFSSADCIYTFNSVYQAEPGYK